ncbi:helix-turn-helix transcriptional regulator [Nocardia nova]|uniref:helix-turn-helix transcriptional regulator n=1 Tax=Nocardia nova TaxID=37330 RepID=UPI0018937187|nr:helix-turn-helix domain-containing protein [Nocardia nova]MBF6144229.1 helix-turn-helix domain-containing protein [Nocardia nova]
MPDAMERRKLATDEEFCEFAGISRGQSAQLRYTGRGPKFVKVTGRQVRYRWEDIEAWVDSQSRTSTADRSGAA